MSEKIALKITQASLNQTALDWPNNMANHYAAIDVAVDQHSDMLLTHELSITGYEVNDDFQRTDNKRIYEAAQNIAAYAYAKDPDLIVSIGFPWRLQLRDVFEKAQPDADYLKNALYDRLNLPFNVQAVLAGGKVVAMTAKANLFRDERGYENRYFNEWSFRDAEQYAKMAGVGCIYGTIDIALPDGSKIPFGRPIIYIKNKDGHGYVYATAICEEKWAAAMYDNFPGDDSRYEGLNIIPSIARYLGSRAGLFLEIANASPPSRLKQDKHMHLNNLASRHADVVVDTDGLGTSGATYSQYGHRLISQEGQTISAGRRVQFNQLATTTSIVSIHSAPEASANRTHIILPHQFKHSKVEPETHLAWELPDQKAAWDNPINPDRWKEEQIRNLALWMFDYMRKSGSKRVAEALSGGKDSSFVCSMVRVMVELGMHDLGVEGFCNAMSLPYTDKLLAAEAAGGKDEAVKACMSEMLVAVYMGTNNSSFATWNAAKTLVEGGNYDGGGSFEGIGGKFIDFNIQDLMDFYAYTFAVEKTNDIEMQRGQEIMREVAAFFNASRHQYTPEQILEWEKRLYNDYPEIKRLVTAGKPDQVITYENLQARPREVLIMAMANYIKGMAMANPNLDEAYGAYATFGGDLHSGTINPNAGIHKIDEEALLEYLEQKGVQGVMKRIIALGPANNNRPSAELQPKMGDKVVQFDEEALQGTFFQKAALARLRHHKKIHTENGDRWMNAGELFAKARADELFSRMDDNLLYNTVVYFYQRWEGPAQHKIHASPISYTHGESVDKQTSLRTPNLSGGSRDEIVQLGVDLLFKWAEEDKLGWDKQTYNLLRARSWQDLSFMQQFYRLMHNHNASLPNVDHNLRGLYDVLKEKGWDEVFSPLNENHPVTIVHQSSLEML